MTFEVDEVLAAHGVVRRREGENAVRAPTDAKGEVVVWYEPNPEDEAAQRLPDEFVQEEEGTFTVGVDPMTALGALGVLNLAATAQLIRHLAGLDAVEGKLTIAWHDPGARIVTEEELRGFQGTALVTLETCDQESWTGAVAIRGRLSTPAGVLDLVADSELEVVVPPGSSVGEAPVLIDTTMEGSVEGATVRNDMTQTGTLRLELAPDGTATITLDLDAGTQDISISAEGMTIRRSATIEPEKKSWTAQMEPMRCEEGGS